MKQKFELEHMNEMKQVSIEPVVYRDKHMYEVEIDGEYYVVYQEGSEWKQEADEKLGEELFEKIAGIIQRKLSRLQA